MKDNSIFSPIEQYIHDIDKIYVPKAFYPSMASCKNCKTGKIIGKCLRAMYYQWKGEPITNHKTYRSWLSQELGNAWEDAFLTAYQRRGILKERGVKYYTSAWGLPITFKLDGVTKKNEIIECKSCYGRNFFFSVSNEPRDSDLVQIIIYLSLTPYHAALLPYGSRDETAHRLGYRITKEEIEAKGILMAEILYRWKALQFYLEASILPPRDFDIMTDWMCQYCAYNRPPLCYTQKEIDEFFESREPKSKRKGKKEED